MEDKFKHWLESIPREESRLCTASCWAPAADIYQTDEGWLVKFDLSGVRPEDIRLHIHGRRLIVAGIRRDRSQQAGLRFYRMEISYNSFQRSVELPGEIDEARVQSEFQDGMLLVRLCERNAP